MTIEVVPSTEPPNGAVISPDGIYRYRLWRTWGKAPRMVWIMLNPSTADAELDDPTIRRCIGFAKREQCGGIDVINLYALRATKPAHLLDHPDPEGPGNHDAWVRVLLNHHGPVVAAWGAWRSSSAARTLPYSRAAYEALARNWLCLGKTQSGDPRHPLYVGTFERLVDFR